MIFKKLSLSGFSCTGQTISQPSFEICAASTFSITPTGSTPNTKYTWVAPSSISGTSQTIPQDIISDTVYNVTTGQTSGTYNVRPYDNNGCYGNDFTFNVTVNPVPFITGQSMTIDSGTSFNIIPTNGGVNRVPPGTTYVWTVGSYTGVTGESDQTTPVSAITQTLTSVAQEPVPVVYNVTPISGVFGNCTGNTFTVTITVNPPPIRYEFFYRYSLAASTYLKYTQLLSGPTFSACIAELPLVSSSQNVFTRLAIDEITYSNKDLCFDTGFPMEYGWFSPERLIYRSPSGSGGPLVVNTCTQRLYINGILKQTVNTVPVPFTIGTSAINDTVQFNDYVLAWGDTIRMEWEDLR